MFYPPNFPKQDEAVLKKIVFDLINREDNIKTRNNLEQQIKQLIKKYNYPKQPKLWTLYFTYLRHFKDHKISQHLIDLLKVVKIRSLSGVVPLSVFTKPDNSCPYNCVYCPIADNAPKSYFPDEAAVRRAISHNYDPFEQTSGRLIQFYLSGHNINKVDVIIQGGTFSFYPKNYRQNFVKRIFDACNCDWEALIIHGKHKDLDQTSPDLITAQTMNETAKSRVIGITIETRPDFITQDEIKFLRQLGVTEVELGVQTTDEATLRLIKRGHRLKDVYQATYLLKEAGFKVTYHLMPGLPGSTVESDIKMLEKVFSDNRLKPDAIKFYPTQIVYNSQLLDWYKNNKYKPITESELTKIVLEFKKRIVPEWLRIHRLVRDLTKNDIAVPTFPSNYRQNLEKVLKKQGVNCPCIRCREIKANKPKLPLKLKNIKYSSAKGIEYFLQFVDSENKILGFLRLRIPHYTTIKQNFFIKDLNNSALIRQLHIYGKAEQFGTKGQTQHLGLGRKLVFKAISIAKRHKCKNITVISGVGVRNYYKKLGFKLENNTGYMIRSL
ncbi:MAG: tRNA uridine(34) 5-carboxymethylaminomethyl modification radical SAM/GNAT enzyme Elp3 [Patescibacteria group bacterium]|nr:MAG: tRNA uridine(34) 5-carboxymethylaminomethyl modification radical SAM/GNAT enzyme Elp3 [Patescibacteria group bacterium]